MSPAERISRSLANGGHDRIEAAMRPMPGIIQSKAASRTQKVIMLRKLADQIADVVAPHTICRKGCSQCCHQHVMLSELEARLIEKATGRARATPQRIPGPQLAQATREKQARYIGVPCTFLGADGACTIYEHRPTKCRVHFSLADEAALCDTSRGLGVRDLPMYENAALSATEAFLIHDTTLADIREFFPREE